MISEAIADSAVLIPIAAIIGMSAWGWRQRTAYVLAAIGFGVSGLADLWSYSHDRDPVVTFFYLPPQVLLVLWALLLEKKATVFMLTAVPLFALLGIVSHGISAPRGDWLVTVVGSVVLLAASFGYEVLRWPVGLYFGAGSLAYLGMILTWGEPVMLSWWFVYQGFRVAALCALAGAVLLYREEMTA